MGSGKAQTIDITESIDFSKGKQEVTLKQKIEHPSTPVQNKSIDFKNVVSSEIKIDSSNKMKDAETSQYSLYQSAREEPPSSPLKTSQTKEKSE